MGNWGFVEDGGRQPQNAWSLKGTKLPDQRVGQSDHTMFCYTYVYIGLQGVS